MAESAFDIKAGPLKGFFCQSGQTFNTIRELKEALKNCSSDEQVKLFNSHVSSSKNDFAAWINDVFGMRELAQRLKGIQNPAEFAEELEKYEAEISVNPSTAQNKEEQLIKMEKNREEKSTETQKGDIQSTSNYHQYDNVNMEALKTEMNDRSDRADHTFDRVKKIRQHSFFNKADFAESIEQVKDRYEELQRAISGHRKEGKDMGFPAMLIRNIHPKINYFQVSQNKLDYDLIVESLDEVEQEIRHALKVENKDLKEEILEQLRQAEVKHNN